MIYTSPGLWSKDIIALQEKIFKFEVAYELTMTTFCTLFFKPLQEAASYVLISILQPAELKNQTTKVTQKISDWNSCEEDSIIKQKEERILTKLWRNFKKLKPKALTTEPLRFIVRIWVCFELNHIISSHTPQCHDKKKMQWLWRTKSRRRGLEEAGKVESHVPIRFPPKHLNLVDPFSLLLTSINFGATKCMHSSSFPHVICTSVLCLVFVIRVHGNLWWLSIDLFVRYWKGLCVD